MRIIFSIANNQFSLSRLPCRARAQPTRQPALPCAPVGFPFAKYHKFCLNIKAARSPTWENYARLLKAAPAAWRAEKAKK
jgi:hypothetical protein